jgi:hypothetical protein
MTIAFDKVIACALLVSVPDCRQDAKVAQDCCVD